MERSIQEGLSSHLCWGCGIANERGLHIESFWSPDAADETLCTWQPEPHHAAGPPHVLNGGIIATLVDCHSVCTAMADAYRSEGRAIGSSPPIWYATASLAVEYLAPTPLDRPVTLRARITARKGRRTLLSCSLRSGERECARAEVVAVRVPREWSDPR